MWRRLRIFNQGFIAYGYDGVMGACGCHLFYDGVDLVCAGGALSFVFICG